MNKLEKHIKDKQLINKKVFHGKHFIHKKYIVYTKMFHSLFHIYSVKHVSRTDFATF